jgi:ATP-binding cassette subfamily B protein
MAGFERVSVILNMESNLPVVKDEHPVRSAPLLEFRNVHFGYDDGKEILHNINFSLEKGKTYALVGPTGGGKTTTASLLARLYDPQEGQIFLNGKNIRSFNPVERTQRIGFILQEPLNPTGDFQMNNWKA